MQLAPTIAYHHLTVDDYHKLGEAGILHEDDRVELVEGMLIDIAPIGTGHAGQVNRLVDRLAPAVSGRAIVAPQNPLRLDEFSEPQPNVLLLRYRDDFYATTHPRPSDVLLLIEVADTSRAYDRDTKDPALCTPCDSRGVVDRRARSSDGDVPGACRQRLPPDPPARGHRSHQPRTVPGRLNRRS